VAERSVFVIFNPGAGRGRARELVRPYLESLRRHLPGAGHAVTERPGEERALADRALAEGCDTLAAMGGDGTWSNVADRILRSGRREVALGLLPAGTGNDFGKSLGVRFGDPEAAVRAVARGTTRTVDVGRAGERHFLNVLGFGFDLAVIADAARTPFLKGDALYRFCALKQLFRFPGLPLELADGAGRAVRGSHLMLIIANARYFGGTFLIAPRAELADGRLDAVAIRDAGPLRRAKLFRLVAKGEHERAPEVTCWQSPRFRAVFESSVPYEVDGEVFTMEASAIEVESVPGALRVIVP